MTTKKPQLRGSRTLAKDDVRHLADSWHELHGLVWGPMFETAIQNLKEARARFPQLSIQTGEKLTRIFEQDSVGREFQALGMPCTDQNEFDVREALAVAATQRIDWLTKLQNDLPTFPESGRIAVGGSR